MALTLTINGHEERLADLNPGASLAEVLTGLGLKLDRVAVECNGEIASRANWPNLAIVEGDRLEIVHFVGGG